MDNPLFRNISVASDYLKNQKYSSSYIRSAKRIWLEFDRWISLNNPQIKNFQQVTLEEVSGFLSCFDLTLRSQNKYSNSKISEARRFLYILFSVNDCEWFPHNAKNDVKTKFLVLNEVFEFVENSKWAKTTKEDKIYLLKSFDCYLNRISCNSLQSLTFETIENYISTLNSKSSLIRNHLTALRQYLSYIYSRGFTKRDYSLSIVIPSKAIFRRRPDSYTSEEISQVLGAVERSSAIGKRDYVILLLASIYGMRCGDIIRLKFSNIDWENSRINFISDKTKIVCDLPLLPVVGNAIIDWLQNGRPRTNSKNIIVSLDSHRFGAEISSSCIYSIVNKYMKLAKIKNLDQRKHGPHALRFSLASSLLKVKTPMPIIASILGHSGIETTKDYIKVDVTNLRLCSLCPPDCISSEYLGINNDD